MTEATIVM